MEHPIRVESEVPPRDNTRHIRWRQRWREVRQRGRLSYVLRRGILLWGVLFAIWMTLARVFGLLGRDRPARPAALLISFVFAAIFFGTLMGLWAWRQNEKRFKALDEASVGKVVPRLKR